VLKDASAYFTIDVETCNEKTKLPGDPECATKSQIDEYMVRKFLVYRVINEKIDFGSFDNMATRQFEVYVP